MASFTGVGDNVVLAVSYPGEKVDIALSGTYNMTILFQREVGSVGSGSWETLRTYTTANATVAESHYTDAHDQRYRLIVTVDTSGTCTATLTDTTTKRIGQQFGPKGEVLWEAFEGSAFVPTTKPVALDAAVSLTREKHANRPLIHSAAAGYDVTLPAATGSGDSYTIFVATTVATTSLVVEVASAADTINGGLDIATDIAGVTLNTSSTTDTITMNGSTTGGVVGSWVRLTDVASGKWMLEGFLVSSGAEATPFSAAV